MTDKEKIITDAAVFRDGKKRLTCEEAQKISKEHDIPLNEIGNICNEQGIKIIECQLGCFK